MANIKVITRNNNLYIGGRAYPDGSNITSTSSGNYVNIYDSNNNRYIVRNHAYTGLVDASGSALAATAALTAAAINDYINTSNPDKVMAADDKASFTGKSGYTVIVDQTNEQITSSGKLLFTASDIKLGDDLNVQNYSIYTSTTNGDVQLTPNGTGSVNLDGTVQFKRFDTSNPADIPSAEEGKMYADEADNLFFGVS